MVKSVVCSVIMSDNKDVDSLNLVFSFINSILKVFIIFFYRNVISIVVIYCIIESRMFKYLLDDIKMIFFIYVIEYIYFY